NWLAPSFAIDGVAPWPDPIPLSEVPDAPPFPTHLLPAPLQRLVKEIAWAANVAEDMVAVPMLAIAGGALANSRPLAIPRTHIQTPCLFAATVCRPGTGKSIPPRILGRPLEEIQGRWIAEWKHVKEAWEERDEGERGPPPVLPRCIVDDSTAESLKL